jgi:hypothetical protein
MGNVIANNKGDTDNKSGMKTYFEISKKWRKKVFIIYSTNRKDNLERYIVKLAQ